MKKKSKSDSSLKIDIDYVVRLANLPLTKEEKGTFKRQLKEILNYFAKLDEIKTEKIEPIGHITDLTNIQREDSTTPSISQKDALVNAPQTHNGFFEVNAIFEE